MSQHYEPFQVPDNVKDDDYFIAVAKEVNVHSFVMLGVMVDNKPVFLARVGKGYGCCVGAFLRHESLYPYGSISYQAYTITEQQFSKFIGFIEKNDNAKPLNCYQRAFKKFFRYQSVKQSEQSKSEEHALSEEEQRIFKATKTYHPWNTCRHTAIDLTAYVVNDKVTTDRISRLFCINLIASAYFRDGKTEDYFYVFPPPPAGYCSADDSLKYKQLTCIYKRMENLITKDAQSPVTIKKFEALKALYLEQAGISDTRLDIALQSILQWQKDNRTLVAELRKPSFFTQCFGLKSSTETMTNTLVEELEERITLT